MEPIHIYSDVICPWCYVGKARLDAAIARLGAEAPQIFWHPYELDPETPAGGVDRVERLSARYGAGQVAMLDGRLQQMGRDAGLDIDMTKVERIPNTFKAHRLIAFAQAKGKGHAMAGALFKAYFVEGRDISDIDTLLEIGASLGLDSPELQSYFSGNSGVEQLRAEEDEAVQAGLRGVPYYLINGQPMVGAQDIDTFIRALQTQPL